MKILRLKAVNIKALKEIDFHPDANIVIIGGRNGQGKTTALESIEMAIRGASAVPTEPVRHGEDKGEIELWLGSNPEAPDLFIHLKTTPDRKTTMKLLGPDKMPVSKPQSLLDTLYSGVSFSPVAFIGADSQKQAKILRDLVGVDISSIEQEQKEAFDKRTAVNRELRGAQSTFDNMPKYPNLPEEEVSIKDLMAKIREERDKFDAYDKHTRALDQCRERVRQVEEELVRLKTRESELEKALDKLPIPCDIPELESKAEKLEDDNQKIRANKVRENAKKRIESLTTQAQSLTDTIAACEETKKAILEACPYPIPGLSVTESGVLYNGVPFNNCSQAEKLHVSVAIGMALNPKLKVLLVRDGAFLDQDSLKLVCDMANEQGFQVWIERVGDGDLGAVIIENGEIK